MSSSYSGSKNKPSKKHALRATCFTLVSWLGYSSTLKMEAPCFSETSIDFRRTTRRCIPEDMTGNRQTLRSRVSILYISFCTKYDQNAMFCQPVLCHISCKETVIIAVNVQEARFD
jgi:hypothetical protein